MSSLAKYDKLFSMAYIFMDESGDLGFNKEAKGSSKFFVITFLFLEEKRPFEKIIKKVHAAIRKNYRMKSGVLHAAHERPETILKILKSLDKKDSCKIMTIYLNKKKMYTQMQDEKHVLYNYVTNILLDRIITKRLIAKDEPIIFVASQRETKRQLNENFKSYVEQSTQTNHAIKIEMKIKTPHEEKCLQLVDVVSWAIARKYEQGDESYYDIIKELIIEENPLFS